MKINPYNIKRHMGETNSPNTKRHTGEASSPLQGSVSLHIEELVLHGFSPRDRHAIGEAVQTELTRLFTEQGVHPSLGQSFEVERVDAGTFNVKSGTRAEGVGTQVAQSVYGGLGK